jgi:ABC-type glycerol-3-phosphate transport system substrate-binding protein
MPEGGEKGSSWVGGWCISLPKGAKNQELGFEFIRWLCHDAEGTATVGRATGLFPGMRRSPYFDEVRNKRYYSTFLQILEDCRHQRPVMPVQAFYMRQMQRAVDAAVYKQKTPKQALHEAQVTTQRELDLILNAGQ